MGNSACCQANDDKEGEIVLRKNSEPIALADDAKVKSRLNEHDGTGGTAHGQNGTLDKSKSTGGEETQGAPMKPMPNPLRKAMQERMAGSEEKKEPEEDGPEEKMAFDNIQPLDESNKAREQMSDILSQQFQSVQKKGLEDAENSIPQVSVTIEEDALNRNFKSAEKGEHHSMSDIQVQALSGSDSKVEPNKSHDVLVQSPDKETPMGQTPGQSSVKQPQDAPSQVAKQLVGEVKTFQKDIEAEHVDEDENQLRNKGPDHLNEMINPHNLQPVLAKPDADFKKRSSKFVAQNEVQEMQDEPEHVDFDEVVKRKQQKRKQSKFFNSGFTSELKEELEPVLSFEQTNAAAVHQEASKFHQNDEEEDSMSSEDEIQRKESMKKADQELDQLVDSMRQMEKAQEEATSGRNNGGRVLAEKVGGSMLQSQYATMMHFPGQDAPSIAHQEGQETIKIEFDQVKEEAHESVPEAIPEVAEVAEIKAEADEVVEKVEEAIAENSSEKKEVAPMEEPIEAAQEVSKEEGAQEEAESPTSLAVSENTAQVAIQQAAEQMVDQFAIQIEQQPDDEDKKAESLKGEPEAQAQADSPKEPEVVAQNEQQDQEKEEETVRVSEPLPVDLVGDSNRISDINILDNPNLAASPESVEKPVDAGEDILGLDKEEGDTKQMVSDLDPNSSRDPKSPLSSAREPDEAEQHNQGLLEQNNEIIRQMMAEKMKKLTDKRKSSSKEASLDFLNEAGQP